MWKSQWSHWTHHWWLQNYGSKRVHTQAQWCVWDYSTTNSLESGAATRLEALLPICPGTSTWQWTLSLVLGQSHPDRPPRCTQTFGHFHRNVESENDHCSSQRDFGYRKRACKVRESTEGSWSGQGTRGSPESGIIEYLPHSPFFPWSSGRKRPTATGPPVRKCFQLSIFWFLNNWPSKLLLF